MESAAGKAKSILAGSKLAEVSSGLWDYIIVEFDNDTTSLFTINGDVHLSKKKKRSR